ncbi:MAG: peptide-methionine (S)-S-oxide reductase MsrA [Acholeplasmatales bacterium]|nr:peptide-methionine (S)-S-oxide reductase MsrA [Acholeplasmatales bacterium]
MIEIYKNGSDFKDVCQEAGLVTSFKRDSYAIIFKKGDKQIIFVSPYSGILYTSGDIEILNEGLDALWRLNLKISGINMQEEYANKTISYLEEKYGIKAKLLMKNEASLSYVLEEAKLKRALFAGGCFWCISAPFYDQEGVLNVYSGYAGGNEINPKYQEVKSQVTGHKECILIEYDSTLVDYTRLVDIYFENIDPFDDEGQFIDRGDSYAPAVFTSDLPERNAVIEYKYQLSDECERECKVELLDNTVFYMAEDEHQDFAIKHKDLLEKELIESGRKKI